MTQLWTKPVTSPIVRLAIASAALMLLAGALPAPAAQGPANPDALYRDRDQPASVRAAIDIWRTRLDASPDDLDAGWKLARACYWMGTNGADEDDSRKAWLEDGIVAARTVIAHAPERPHGHFWLAANMGALAESHGLVAGIRYRGRIREAIERVLALDPAYLDGSADRAIGRWFHRVPRLFGGNRTRAEEHLRKALTYDGNSIITLLFLGELLVDRDRDDEARRVLERAVSAPLHPEWEPEDRRFKEQARALLAQLLLR